jgi:hypothetical protein
VEVALTELSKARQQDQRTCAAVDAAAGIDAFEMTLKRLGAPADSSSGGGGSMAGEIVQGCRQVQPHGCCRLYNH